MSLIFGKETLEGGSLPASFDSVGTLFDAATATLDNNSKVTGTYSILFANTDEGGAAAVKDLGSEYTELYIQFKGFLPSGFTFGASGYCGFGHLTDSGNNSRLFFNIENFGTVRLTVGGDTVFINTGVDIPINSVFKLEIYIKKNATTGQIKVWLNNDTEGSPDYDSGAINTGATGVQNVHFGKNYVPEAVSDYYLDEFCIGDEFIGAGVVAKGVSDSGSGSDALAIKAKLTHSDSGAGTDVPFLKNSFSISDEAMGDELILLLCRISKDDSGIASEVVSLLNRIAAAEDGSGSDIVSLIARVNESDSGQGDTLVSVIARVATSDTGAATDAVSILVKLAMADSAAGNEALSVLSKLSLSDSGVAEEVVSILAKALASDSGNGQELISLLSKLTIEETGDGNDLLTVMAKVVASDDAIGSEALATVARVAISDSALAGEAVTILTRLLVVESSLGTDAVSVISSLILKMVEENGQADEAISILNTLLVADAGFGADFVQAIHRLLEYAQKSLYSPSGKYGKMKRTSGKGSYTQRSYYKKPQ